MLSPQPHIRGFSLVEIAVVLVIIGLLTGGVIGGRNLLQASRLRSIGTEAEQFVTAVGNFRTQYEALPGDYAKATRVWGTATCPGTASQGSTTIATCDGNGDGVISYDNESFRIWQHLANGNFIEGTYSGVLGNNGYWWSSVASNSPVARFSDGVVWSASQADNTAGSFSGRFFRYDLGNFLHIGKIVSGSWNYDAFLMPLEAWNLDQKLDDGMPGTGKVLGSVVANCTTAATGLDYTAEYIPSHRQPACTLLFQNAF